MNKIISDEKNFILDNGVKFLPATRCITNESGVVVNLSENSYRFLYLLLTGEMDKQIIIDRVWHEQLGQVTDSSYYGQIYILRKALKLAGLSGGLIKTIPRKGVKYMGKVSHLPETQEISAESNKKVDESDKVAEPRVVENKDVNSTNGTILPASAEMTTEWYHSRRWNTFITILAVLAVCWLSTLLVLIIYFLKK